MVFLILIIPNLPHRWQVQKYYLSHTSILAMVTPAIALILVKWQWPLYMVQNNPTRFNLLSLQGWVYKEIKLVIALLG
jgi:hypothetical protein